MKKNWSLILSPCVILAALAIYGIIASYINMQQSGGWSYIGVIVSRNTLLFTIIADLIARLLLRKRVLLFWVIELIAILLYYFIYLRPFLN